MVGFWTLETVITLFIKSECPRFPTFQSSDAAILKIVPSTEVSPFLFNKPLIYFLSVVLSNIVNWLDESISIDSEVSVYGVFPSPTIASLETFISEPPVWVFKLAPLTTRVSL